MPVQNHLANFRTSSLVRGGSIPLTRSHQRTSEGDNDGLVSVVSTDSEAGRSSQSLVELLLLLYLQLAICTTVFDRSRVRPNVVLVDEVLEVNGFTK